MSKQLRPDIIKLLTSIAVWITHNFRRLPHSFARIMSKFFSRIRTTLYSWIRGFWNDVMGPTGYRAIAVLVAAYVGLFTIIEARHDRQLSFAATERNVFITMVSSGERGSFVAAMKNFGPLQTTWVFDEPSLFELWNWWEKTQPNLEPLYSWALYRLALCTPDKCGQPGGYRIDLQDGNLNNAKLEKISLIDSDLRFSQLNHANLTSANLNGANLACASLVNSNLRNAKLEGAVLKLTSLVGADLEGANLRNAHIAGYNPFAFVSGTFIADGKTRQSSSQSMPFEAFCGTPNWDGLKAAELRHADLRGVTGLHCGLLKQARNWHLTCRDPDLACGEEIPEPGSQMCPIIESEDNPNSDEERTGEVE